MHGRNWIFQLYLCDAVIILVVHDDLFELTVVKI